jgi:hypothetical protein
MSHGQSDAWYWRCRAEMAERRSQKQAAENDALRKKFQAVNAAKNKAENAAAKLRKELAEVREQER